MPTASELATFSGRLGTFSKYPGITIRVRCEEARPEFGQVRYTLRPLCEACGHLSATTFRSELQHIAFDEGGE
jgi:hypothetical protein